MDTMRLPVIALLALSLVLAAPVARSEAPVPVPSAWTGEAARLAAEGLRRLEAGAVAEAETAFRAALALDPREARALAGLGLACLKRGQVMAAVSRFQQAVVLPLPDELAARCYAELGLIREGQGDLDRAIRYLLRAVRLYPLATYEAQLARLYLGAGLLDEAQAAIEAARLRDPEDAAAQRLEAQIRSRRPLAAPPPTP